MRLRGALGLLAAAATLLGWAGQARATPPDPDPWWGRDKALHFGASALIAGTGYAIGTSAFDHRSEALLLGGGLALTAGAGKELYDMTGRGDPSWRDFTWDVIGTAVGLGVAWGIDLAVRGTESSAPLGAARSGIVLTF